MVECRSLGLSVSLYATGWPYGSLAARDCLKEVAALQNFHTQSGYLSESLKGVYQNLSEPSEVSVVRNGLVGWNGWAGLAGIAAGTAGSVGKATTTRYTLRTGARTMAGGKTEGLILPGTRSGGGGIGPTPDFYLMDIKLYSEFIQKTLLENGMLTAQAIHDRVRIETRERVLMALVLQCIMNLEESGCIQRVRNKMYSSEKYGQIPYYELVPIGTIK